VQISIPGYKIIREINRGGQAVLYKATQQSTGRQVAVKIIREGPLAGPDEHARFEREVQILAALNHPNIVNILDRGETADGSYLLVMEYIGSRPLDEHLNDYRQRQGNEKQDPAELLRLFMKIADAVNAAHLRSVVHRDLKPSNIRIDQNGEPHILDFGLARNAMVTMTDEANPRPVQWASPEQAEGIASKIDLRSDVYSLGVILYQMLTGQFPYVIRYPS
jgi:eukaryotic-like serine/threonine-protein kinase